MTPRDFKGTPPSNDDLFYSANSSGIGLRQWNGNDAMWDEIAKEYIANREKQVKASHSRKKEEFALSPDEELTLKELKSRKAQSIQDIPARKQARIRRILNQEREQQKKTLIKYPDDINPNYPSYKSKYAQLIVNYYNSEIDYQIHELYDEKIYEHEFKKVQRCTKATLQKQIQKIPHDVKHEIIHSLKIDSQDLVAQKKEVQQKIVAVFNTFY